MLNGEDLERILIVKLGSIGDVVHALPTLNALGRSFPVSHISWVVEPDSKDLLLGHRALSELIVFERDRSSVSKTVKAFFRLIKRLRQERYDVVLDLQGTIKSGMISFLSGSSVRLGFARGSSRIEKFSHIFADIKVKEGNCAHIVERNLQFARRLGAEPGEVKFDIPIRRDAEDYVNQFLRNNGIYDKQLVALNPGAGWSTKRWSLGKYATLADEISSNFRDVSVILTWGPGEYNSVEEIYRMARSGPIMACRTTIGQLIPLLKRCKVLVSGDTGPLHIAAALGTRSIGLFGPVDSRRNGPYGHGNFVVEAEDLDCLGCWRKECDRLDCMKKIEVSDVLEKVDVCLRAL